MFLVVIITDRHSELLLSEYNPDNGKPSLHDLEKKSSIAKIVDGVIKSSAPDVHLDNYSTKIISVREHDMSRSSSDLSPSNG